MMRLIWFWSQILILSYKNEKKNDTFFHSLWFLTLKYDFFFEHFPLADTFENPPRQQPQPLAMSSKKVWVDISYRLGGVRLPKSDAYKKKLDSL